MLAQRNKVFIFKAFVLEFGATSRAAAVSLKAGDDVVNVAFKVKSARRMTFLAKIFLFSSLARFCQGIEDGLRKRTFVLLVHDLI